APPTPAGRRAIRIPSVAQSFRIVGGHGKTIPAVAHETCPAPSPTRSESMFAQPLSIPSARLAAFLRRTRRAAAFLALLSLAACQSLLPTARETTDGPWETYEDAVAAIEALVPYRTTMADLRAAGIDPETTPSITNLTYSDLIARFSPHPAVRPEDLDRGLRACFMPGQRRRRLPGAASKVRHRRAGHLGADTVDFRRQTDITGWRFNATIIVVDDVVVFAVHGGQPTVQDRRVARNPLGPLQSFGEALGSQLAKRPPGTAHHLGPQAGCPASRNAVMRANFARTAARTRTARS